MPVTLDLPPEIVTRLNDRARQEGRTPDAIDSWLRGPVTATLDKIDSGNGHFYTVPQAEQCLAQRRTHRGRTSPVPGQTVEFEHRRNRFG